MPRTHDGWVAAAPAAARPAGRAEVLRRLLHAVRHPRPGSGTIGPGRMAMHFMRCAAHLDTFRDWFGNPAHRALRHEIAARPYLLTCVVHPYLNSGWQAPRKLAAIAAHYAMLDGRRALLRAPSPTLLAEVGEGLRIELDRPGKFEHEGESTLHLRRGEEDLFALAFTLGELAGQRVAYVGALQGLRSPDALEIYRTLTHQLHGLRPRDLLLTAFRRLCLGLGVARILAVDDTRRVSSNAYFATSTQVLSSYDQAWRDSGGVPAPDGFFEIGVVPVRREDAAVPARKRALYRRRYAMLDALSRQVDAAIAPGATGAGEAARPVSAGTLRRHLASPYETTV